MKVVVYGTGGVGGYFGGRLAQAGADVHLIARGAHLETLRAEGLRVRSPKGDFEVRLPATDDPSEPGTSDVVLFCVKSFDTEAAAAHLTPLIREETAVLSLQNGIDNEDKLSGVVGAGHVMGGAAYIFATIESPGHVVHSGGPASIVFGELDGSRSNRATRLLELCAKAGIEAKLSEDIHSVLWDKFAFICAVAGMTASVRLPIGDIRSVAESWGTFRSILEEVCEVAAAEGVKLPQGTVDRHVSFAEGLDPGSFSSLHHDMTHGNRMELEALHGTLVRLAGTRGIPAPVSGVVYAILKPWAVRRD